MSCTPDLVEDAEQNQHQTAPDKYDYLLAIVSDNRHIVLDVWVALEKLMAPAPDQDTGDHKHDHGESESDTQRRNARLFYQRDREKANGFHIKNVLAGFNRCYDASVGFSVATEGHIAIISFEGGHAGERPTRPSK